MIPTPVSLDGGGAKSFLGKVADRRRLDLVLSAISKEMKLLDLGCGNGWLVRRLRREGFNVTGIDTNLPLEETDWLSRRSAYKTGFPTNTFDAVICLETIEHLDSRAYAEIRRISKNGCKLLVTTPKKKWNWLIELLSSAGLSEPLVTPHINVVDSKDIPFELEKSGSLMLFEWYGIYIVSKGECNQRSTVHTNPVPSTV